MKILFSLLLSFSVLHLFAQNLSNDILKQQMIKDWERAKAYTLEYLNAMPAGKYNLRPTDSVRSFAEQMLHFAISNAGMSFIGTGIVSNNLMVFVSPNFGKSPGSQQKDSVTYYVVTSYDMVIKDIKEFDFNKAAESVSWDLPGGKRTTTRYGWLQKAFEHQTHHRGQCTIYLRLAGVQPPAERLWE